MKTLIFLAGDPPGAALLERTLVQVDFVIAADGGIQALRPTGRVADIWIGDFDSADGLADEAAVHQIIHAPEQDASDFQKALRQLPDATCELIILGGTGGRSDHFISNLLITLTVDVGLPLRFISDRETLVRVTPDCAFEFDSLACGMDVSLIPLLPCEGVRTGGLHWPLQDEALAPEGRLGQSNRVDSSPVSVSLTRGQLYVIHSGAHSSSSF